MKLNEHFDKTSFYIHFKNNLKGVSIRPEYNN